MAGFGALPRYLRTRKRRAKARATLRRVVVNGRTYMVRPASRKKRSHS